RGQGRPLQGGRRRAGSLAVPGLQVAAPAEAEPRRKAASASRGGAEAEGGKRQPRRSRGGKRQAPAEAEPRRKAASQREKTEPKRGSWARRFFAEALFFFWIAFEALS